MARVPEPSDLLTALRNDFVPFLQKCSDPEQLPELLSRLANCLVADGAVLWRFEENQILPQATFGVLRADWAAAHRSESAGAASWQNAASVVVEANRGPYLAQVVGQPLAQVAAIPIRGPRGFAGSIELAWKPDGRGRAPIAQIFSDLEDAFQQVLPALLGYEASRQNSIRAITRLMMLYDVGKVFHSTLELGELAPLILARVQSIVDADSAAVWLLDPVRKSLYCAAAAGPRDPSMDSMRMWPADPGLGETLQQGEAVLLHDIEDAAWTGRWGSPIRSLLVVPLSYEGRFLGACEAIRGANAAPFSEEDLRVLVDVGKQAAVALRNAQRYQAERRVKELHALMEISKEITATLDLDRVLAATVNRVTQVIPADRCSVSILRKGRREVNAISGEAKVDAKTPAVQGLTAMHEWLAGLDGDLSVAQTDEGITSDHEEIREKFSTYFQKTGFRALTGLLLKDEEGAVGVLVLESKEPQALTASHNELARIFANQVTSAIRNAMLYRQVPLIGVLQPLVQKKAKFAALPVVRQRVIIGIGIAVLLFLIFFPWWSKPAGDARVLPERVQPVSAEVEGVVRNVLVREGDRVTAGQPLAELASDEPRVALEQAQAQYDILGRRVLQLEAQGDLGAARIERARWQQAAAELELHRTQLTETQIRSPISGVVVTPHLDERVGQNLHRGDVFCQVVNLDHAWAEIGVPETEVGAIKPGEEAWLKLNTYPNRKFVGKVIQVAPQAREQLGERFFDVIVDVPNPDHLLRAGMMGRGKVLAERGSIGYLMLRAPARWMWLKLWTWLP
jgi:GAF domain-containing protein/biotin carboxyl carrier protein